VLNGHGLEHRKLAGRVQGLRDLLGRSPVRAAAGSGTTPGQPRTTPNELQRAPAPRRTGTLALVHNGIIENATCCRRLTQEGHRFATETDTETPRT